MRIPRYVFAAIFCLLSFSPIICQQGRSNPATGEIGGYTLSAKSKLVTLDVIVTDKKGNPVTNLTKDEFKVLENMQLQRINNFEAPAAHAVPQNIVIHSSEELDRLAPNAPVDIIVLDEYVSNFGDIYTARSAIQQYLQKQPLQLARPTMLVAANVDKTIMLQDFTQDKNAILTALNRHDAGAADYSGSKSRFGQDFIFYQAMAGFRTLEQLAQITEGHSGHKHVIWVGRGLPKLLLKGDHPWDTVISSDKAFKLHMELQQMIDLLIAARVTLSTIDLRGVQWADLSTGGSINGIDDSVVSFSEVAIATGGARIYQRNDMDAAIADITHDDSEFYTLTYVPANSDNSAKFRKIRVEMKDPNLHAKTRTGYYPNPEAEPGWQLIGNKNRKSTDHVFEKELADTTLIANGIPLTLTRTETPGQILVEMAPGKLPWIDHGPNQPRTAKVLISCASFDKNGKMLLHERNDTELTDPATTPGSSQGDDVEFSLNCDSSPRVSRLRVVIQATDSGKVGAANLDLGIN